MVVGGAWQRVNGFLSLQCLGQVGVVKKVRSNGDVEVQFEQFHWILNSACVDPTPDATPPDIKEEIKEEFSRCI